MSDDNLPLPAPGWYPDPAGTPRTRWWNGSGWSDSFGAPAAQVAQATAAATQAAQASAPAAAPATPWATPSSWQPQATPPATGFPTAPGYTNAPAYGAVTPPKAPEGTSPITPFVWILALLPLVAIIINVVSLATLDQIVDDVLAEGAPLYTPFDLITGLVGWIVVGLSILFGVLDYRALVRAGVPKPFHWAWIFFAVISAPVYMIGRSVVVRRRVGSGLAPMFVNFGLLLVNVIMGIAAFVIAFTAAMPLVSG